MTPRLIHHLGRHNHRADTLLFSPDGQTLASAAWDRDGQQYEVCLWRTSDRAEVLRTYNDWEGLCPTFSPDCRYFAMCDLGNVVIRDANHGAIVRRLSPRLWAQSVAIDQDSDRIAISTDGFPVHVWSQLGAGEQREYPTQGSMETVGLLPPHGLVMAVNVYIPPERPPWSRFVPRGIREAVWKDPRLQRVELWRVEEPGKRATIVDDVSPFHHYFVDNELLVVHS
ncbi:MAG: hypothetical protein C4547_10490 [Phycisphaerales bacterium]|nr:MAG: hypothetical protein C4547_10490 [Phycisphaerales bacterium]